MPKKNSRGILPSEITPESLYRSRRQFLTTFAGITVALPGLSEAGWFSRDAAPPPKTSPLPAAKKSPLSTTEPATPLADVTTYNNFYEFGTDKASPAETAGSLITRPWTIAIEGEVHKPGTYAIDDLIKLAPLEDRIYRLRCVEGWSMVIPWVGYSLATVLRRAEPTGNAKFVEFVSLEDPKQMPGQRSGVLDWPYREGLRIDEAMHPLTLLTFGLYGQTLPNQNGAPVRIVVPWKYGFKSAKSIVKIRLTEKPPVTTWMKAAPREYGFFSNVNPAVDHPRWSQAKERRIGELAKRPTLPFNGYANEVAQLYTGMDLRRYF